MRFPRACHLVWFILALLVAVTSTSAMDAKIGKVSVVLTAPEEFCELQDGQPADGVLLNRMRKLSAGQLRLLAVYADCRQLRALRERDEPLNDVAQFITPLVALDSSFSADRIAQLCAQTRLEGQKVLGEVEGELGPRIKEIVGEGLKVNEMRFLGVLAEEQAACFAAYVQKISFNEIEKLQLVIQATILIKGKIVFFYLAGPYEKADALAIMLAKHKANVSLLYAANRE